MRRSINPILQLSITPIRLNSLHNNRNNFGFSNHNCTNIGCIFERRGRGEATFHRFQQFSYNCSKDCGRKFGAPKMALDGSESTSSPSAVAPKPRIRFCQSCGNPTKQLVPDGEERTRAVCTHCGNIHYENPKMVVGCLVEHNGKVLLCKRRIQPSYGFWTLPAGFMEIGESALEGAVRETLEEACAEVEGLSPFAQIDIPRIGQVYLIFRAKLKDAHFAPGPESLECQLFSLHDIPFDSLAFSSIIVTLKLYVEDVKAGDMKFHYCTINKRPGASMTDPNGFDVDYLLPL